MTKLEEALVDMQAKVEDFLGKNATAFNGFARLESEINKFSGYRLLLAPYIAKQSVITTGITEDKTMAFANMVDLAVNIANKALVFANDNNNQTLAAVFNVNKSTFNRVSQAKKLALASTMADALAENAPALAAYAITDADIKAIADAVATCKGIMIAPGTAASTKKAATTAIKNLLKEIVASLKVIDKLIVSQYTKSNPDLVNEYLNNRQVDGSSARHTGITAFISDAKSGKAIENAAISIAALNKTAISGIDGIAQLTPMRTGTYHISFSANGYATQTQDVTVARSKVVEVAVALVSE